jgi:hypothetical protein
MALTAEETVKYTRWLGEAEEALHRLSTGRALRVLVDQNGERTEYNTANRQGLISYINQLRASLGMPPMCGIVLPPAGVFL